MKENKIQYHFNKELDGKIIKENIIRAENLLTETCNLSMGNYSHDLNKNKAKLKEILKHKKYMGIVGQILLFILIKMENLNL